MKFIAILFCTFTMLLAANYTKKIEIGLCKLINEREMAKFYGDTRNYDALSKKIDGYKFRFGLKDLVTAAATIMMTTMMMVLSVDIDVATMTLEESIEDLIDRHKSHNFKEI